MGEKEDRMEFSEYQTPEYWMKRRARRALLEHLAPAAIVIAMLVAFLITGLLEVSL